MVKLFFGPSEPFFMVYNLTLCCSERDGCGERVAPDAAEGERKRRGPWARRQQEGGREPAQQRQLRLLHPRPAQEGGGGEAKYAQIHAVHTSQQWGEWWVRQAARPALRPPWFPRAAHQRLWTAGSRLLPAAV